MSNSQATVRNSLDFDLETFSDLLKEVSDLVVDRYATMFEANAHPGVDQDVVRSWFEENIPQDGTDLAVLMRFVKEHVVDQAVMNIGSRMFSYVMSGGNQVSILADLLTSALDQNPTKWHLAPSMTEIEKNVIKWGGQFIGYADDAAGAIVSGGSAANLTGLTIGRNLLFEKDDLRFNGLCGSQPLTVYCSTEAHSSIDKSIELLGIGSRFLRKIPVDSNWQIDCGLLEAAIQADLAAGLRPFCIIGNAGTVNTGSIDPLARLSVMAKRYGLWFHVDGCYGALVAGLPDKKACYKGLKEADSVAIDFHKWLYQPFEIGCVLVREWSDLRRTFHKAAFYLDTDKQDGGRFDITEHHFNLSRNAKAFKVWLSLKAYGMKRFQAMIAKDLELAQYLADHLKSSEDFELVSGPGLGVVCFRFVGRRTSESEVEDLNCKLVPALELDRRVFLTGTRLLGKQVLRACIINHRMQRGDIDFLINVVREVAGGLDD